MGALIRSPSTAHDAWPAIMHCIRQFRFYRDDVYAAFLPVAGNQPLNPLPWSGRTDGCGLDVFLHETFDGQFHHHIMKI